MHLQPVFFDLIRDGKKTIELRLWDDKRRQIMPEDEIIFVKDKSDETVITKVKNLFVAKDFDSLFEIIDIKKSGFATKEIALYTIEQFCSKTSQQQNGVVGIEITLLK
jgi:ASC-1-like (ASCH) protein